MNELKHIAIIMDGNGRWAQQKQKPRSFGHQEGARRVKDITLWSKNKGIKYLTLYAFSTENWKRPKLEIDFLMKLLKKYLKDERNMLIENKIKFQTIGDLSKFPNFIQNEIEISKKATEHFECMTQILALNYGSRDEILRAAKNMLENEKTEVKDDFTIEIFNKYLDTKNIPDVDILVRTGGQKRLSNFLLWQISYAELFFTDTLWPDFTEKEFDDIVFNFKNIKRNFGGI